MILNGFDSDTNTFIYNLEEILNKFDKKESLDIASIKSNFDTIQNCLNKKNNADIDKCLEQHWSNIIAILRLIDCFHIGNSSKLLFNSAKLSVFDKKFPKGKPGGIMIHCPAGQRAPALISRFKKEGTSVHFIIDRAEIKYKIKDEKTNEEKENTEIKTCVYLTAPLCYQAGHCGIKNKDTFNSSMIAIENCDPPELDFREVTLTQKEIDEINGDKKLKAKKVKKKAQELEGNSSKYIIINDKIHKIKNDDEVLKAAYEYYQDIRNTSVDLCAMLCCLYGFEIDKTSKTEKGEDYPITVISHREGNKRYKLASTHSDPDELWALYEKLCDNSFSGFMDKKTDQGYTDEIMNPFRMEISERITHYKQHPEKIHPLLKIMYHYYTYKDNKTPP